QQEEEDEQGPGQQQPEAARLPAAVTPEPEAKGGHGDEGKHVIERINKWGRGDVDAAEQPPEAAVEGAELRSPAGQGQRLIARALHRNKDVHRRRVTIELPVAP